MQLHEHYFSKEFSSLAISSVSLLVKNNKGGTSLKKAFKLALLKCGLRGLSVISDILLCTVSWRSWNVLWLDSGTSSPPIVDRIGL